MRRPITRRTRRPALFAALGLASLATPGLATEGFVVPAGCEQILTVQNSACAVSMYWRCGSPLDSTLLQASFSLDGVEAITTYSDDYQWLDAAYTWDVSRETFTPPAADPLSRDALLGTGIDTFDFTMDRETPDRAYQVRAIGADMLTGVTRTIDGFLLEEVATRLEIIASDGVVEYASEGFQHYSSDLGVFFTGPETVTWPDGEVVTYDDAPVDIILPDEPGFTSTTPLYQCDLRDAALPDAAPSPAKKEPPHDPV